MFSDNANPSQSIFYDISSADITEDTLQWLGTLGHKTRHWLMPMQSVILIILQMITIIIVQLSIPGRIVQLCKWVQFVKITFIGNLIGWLITDLCLNVATTIIQVRHICKLWQATQEGYSYCFPSNLDRVYCLHLAYWWWYKLLMVYVIFCVGKCPEAKKKLGLNYSGILIIQFW